MLQEKTYISQFDIQPNGYINVRKTTEIIKDGSVLTSTFWRCCLAPNDPNAQEVLNEPYYYQLAQTAWSSLPTE
jgi:hypothetical protein